MNNVTQCVKIGTLYPSSYPSFVHSMALTFSSDHMYEAHGATSGISDTTLSTHADHIQSVFSRIDQELSTTPPAFLSVLQAERLLKEVHDVYASLRWAKTLVVIGIGGSDLGGRTIQQAFDEGLGGMDVIFHGDSTDPVAIDRLLKIIDLDDTVFVIVSKSGGTLETMTQYLYFQDIMRRQTDEWAEHFVCVTDPQDGILRKEAQKHGMLTLEIPADLGGRFSVLSSVGLFPAAAMGVDIAQMISGGKSAAAQHKDIAKEIARSQFLLHKQGISVSICMAYAIQLQEFTRWYRQLWAESLGKDGTGVLPVAAWGPADQHSQLQFYTQGQLLHSVLFLTVEERESDHVLENIGMDEFAHLNGRTFGELLAIEHQATAAALTDLGRPHSTLSLQKLDAHTLGELFVVFEMAVVYLAGLLGVNPYDQPGVESTKQHMTRLLK